METTSDGIEPVTLTEVLSLDTWNQERSTEQLQGFIARRHSVVGSLTEEE